MAGDSCEKINDEGESRFLFKIFEFYLVQNTPSSRDFTNLTKRFYSKPTYGFLFIYEYLSVLQRDDGKIFS